MGAAEQHKQLNMLLLRMEEPESRWLEKFFLFSFFLFFNLSVLPLLVTLHNNNLLVRAINTSTTAPASISADTSGVPVHEQGSTE